MSTRRLTASAARPVVGIGQRRRKAADGTVVVICQVRRGERRLEARLAGADPRVPRTCLRLAFEAPGGEDESLALDREAA